jgi:hypothetical protein
MFYWLLRQENKYLLLSGGLSALPLTNEPNLPGKKTNYLLASLIHVAFGDSLEEVFSGGGGGGPGNFLQHLSFRLLKTGI